MVTEPVEKSIRLADLDHVYRMEPRWISGSVGAEAQTASRVFGLAIDLGGAVLTHEPMVVSPEELEMETFSSGVLARLSFNVRFPWTTPFAVGLLTAAEGYLWHRLPLSSAWGGKMTVGVLMEWDGSK